MLEIKNVTFQVSDDQDQDKEIIKDISLTIDDHRFIAITGPNGGGKSTLAKLIVGIYEPVSGSILYNGQDITHMSVTDRAKLGISFAFQTPVRFKGIKVKDLIRLAAGRELTVGEACSYLSEVGLCAKDYIEREVDGSLSGGELKRIEIAQLIARDTALYVLDEPEAGIDLWSFSNLIKVFEKMREDRKRSIIIISHQERILDIADEILVMKDGQVADFGRKEDILPELLKGTAGCKYYQ